MSRNKFYAMKNIKFYNFRTRTGKIYNEIPLSYEVFGPPLGSAPVVLVNHALTGNSTVIGEHGWWNDLIGEGKIIDTNQYTILAFNIPGNGYNGFFVDQPEDFSVYDVAQLFLRGLKQVEVTSLYAVIGGSLGGSIAWQLAVLEPELIENLIPIATDWKATDWLLAQCRVQKQILNNSIKPVHDARIHAMTFYRTPQSFKLNFERSFNSDLGMFNIESWLLHHGQKLQERFQLKAYKLMNHLLMSADISMESESFEKVVKPIKSNIVLIGIGSDGFYLSSEITDTFQRLKRLGKQVSYHNIESIYGHDAFLLEFDQLAEILTPVFCLKNKEYEYTTNT